MSSVPTPDEIWSDARWLAQALDPPKRLVRLIAMDREAYRSASFLDDRMLREPLSAPVVPWDPVADAMPADARRDARWIFHIGHVGSTLVSRLLGELDGVLAVREPRLLRDLAMFPPETRSEFVPTVQALLSRGFGADETALVKATSMVGEIAAELVPAEERALFLFATPRDYVRGILAGENSVLEVRGLADMRGERMSPRVRRLDTMRRSDAHLAAAAWACEMTALEAAAEAMPGRAILWADFDRLLDDMTTSLQRIAAFFGFDCVPDQAQALVQGPLMRRYSKALEYDYSPALRRELLDEAGHAHAADIDSALAMLDKSAGESPLLARALERAQPEG